MHNQLTFNYLQRALLPLFLAFLTFFHLADVAAADKPGNAASFDPAKGFKPAQSDLTEVFLQIAGSLEYYGSPEPYLRHMKAEHDRIDAKYRQQFAGKTKSFCPSYMDGAYFERLAANWKHMAPQLGLESLAKSTGRLMRAAINGPDGKPTILADVFKEHQREVKAAMSSKEAVVIPDFDALKVKMVKCLRLDATPVQAGNLPAEQQVVVRPASDAHAAFLKLFSAVDAGLAPADAEKVKTVILGIVTDVGRMAQSELEAGILEESLDYIRSLQGPYSPEQETALTAEERKIYVGFYKKPRFTKADLPALDKFYSTIYDKLTERGKDEMSKRLHAGMRPE